ncbi:MAG: Hint domain-containing protein, partial [Pseudomonadota bacterium]|nr:Hint domain-containing protein [Pseudomonadota bacterium]
VQATDPLTGKAATYLEVLGCYAAGTRIAADTGRKLVEDLREGDAIVTLDGGQRRLRHVTWIGERRLDLSTHPRAELAAPIRFRRGALAEGVPERDLLLSPDHGVFLDGKFVPAKLLVNDMTIVQERDAPSVHYFHFELDGHAVMLAEGMEAESYLDSGNRGFFANGGEAVVLYPEFSIEAAQGDWTKRLCAPLVRCAAEVEPIWRPLVERAVTLGYVRPDYVTTADPDLRLIADGRTIRPISGRGGRLVFMVPPGVTSVRIGSRHASPADLRPYADDWRRLGVAISRIIVRAEAGRTEIPADHPSLGDGWHQPERHEAAVWRWTDGDALLPLPTDAGGLMLEVHVRASMVYRIGPVQDARRVA